jgi:hypothetical protein
MNKTPTKPTTLTRFLRATTTPPTFNKLVAAKLSAIPLAALLIACGSGGGDESGSDTDPGSSGGGNKPAAVAKLNQPAKDGKFQFTVTKMDCSKKSLGKAPVSQKAQGKFCLVNVTVKNIGDEAQLFDSSSQKALDAKGTTYDADGAAGIYLPDAGEAFLNNINPGNQVRGTIVFDVPAAVQVTTLELHDSPFSGGVKVSVG